MGAVTQPSQVSLPPVIGECVTTFQPAQPGAAPQESISRMYRSAEGKIRCDAGNSTVILDLATQQTTMLDHVTKAVSVVPMQKLPAGQYDPSGLAGAVAPPAAISKVQNLGRSIIDGHEVEGKLYTLQPPAVPQPPSMPQAPQLPPSPVTTAEVWTSTRLHLPVLRKMTGDFGQQTTRCRYIEAREPDPALFQVPAGYAPPPPPKLPDIPR
ncbi:MAG: hypothetical protein HY822_17775 [Acidobacteria bacterium]|nr:hypothetical protein [Acidobacteriota bacterium]